MRPTLTTRLKRAAGILLAILLTAALLEGLASFALFAFDLARESVGPVPERVHTRHDPELGWVSIPGARIADLYGPGLGVTINSQGFRGPAELPREVPSGKVRVVCSGDSFTFGFGVADGDTWPARLADLDPRLETVNMGQPGYGLDQMYLWYLRDGHRLEHQVHVFAAVVDDLWRMRSDQFLGYGKPMLKLEDGRVEAAAVPVPSRSYLWPWLSQNAGLFRRLRLAQLIVRLLPAPSATLSDAETWRLAAAAVDSLAALHRAEGRSFLFVFLPTLSDYSSPRFDVQRRALLTALGRRGVAVLDLVQELRRLPQQRVEELFLGPGDVTYGGAEGHYSAAGNLFVAERVHAWMTQAGVL